MLQQGKKQRKEHLDLRHLALCWYLPVTKPKKKGGASEAWSDVHRSQLPRAQSKEGRPVRESEGDREAAQHSHVESLLFVHSLIIKRSA